MNVETAAATEPVAPEAPAASYRRLFATPGLPPLLGSALLTRTATQMWTVGVILLALQRYHSAGLAGLGVFLLIFPGLSVSPLNGALLDRHGRRRLMMLDFSVAAACLLVIVVLSGTGLLPAWLLLSILAVGSLTSTLSIAGARSLFPLTVPRDLWDRANATDSFGYGIAQVAGPALAGGIAAALGSEAALGFAALLYVLGAVVLRGVPEPATPRDAGGRLGREVWRGVRYVVSNPTLRSLAVGLSIGNIGFGMVIVALPVLVFHLHGNAAVAGALLAVQGAVGVPAALLAGRLRTEGRERRIVAGCSVLAGAVTLVLLAPSLAALAVAMALLGAVEGPLNVSVFSLRQRRTSPAWFGRAFAISISLNFSGMPLGSALSGPLLNRSLTLAIAIAAALPVLAGLLMLKLIPGEPAG